ncbi:mitochondrial hypoxia responsive domain containing protein [Sporothrix schenckii 1099-18]|uniref:Mitochondrial hypoxia responsive domain containing protein n=1 Tax=Sporothrix schenckii 1099-18 TaxID=1397361 RepID=A0A0F2M8E2_SPOSC|nr:mitochondrial hypoxia responsive domain containing protein [Sporothrix schenckii 1099-18]KJR85943.1 mitochondrial hypoxia responsive domain containing protein [Sporothrix schenckii 1099-18]
MKVVTKDEEKAHYDAVLRGGFIGGAAGLAVGLLGLTAASRRYAGVRNLTLPFRAFLVTSATSASAIIVAERNSIAFARSRDSMYGYQDASQRAVSELRSSESGKDKTLQWARENRYSIVMCSWAASIGIALALVGRNKYLTTAQKVVQARVYAQGLTLAVILATATLEMSDAKSGKGRWETVKVVDPNDPEHKKLIEKRIHKEEYEGQDLWMDMVAAEERRLAKSKEQKEANAKAVPAPSAKQDNKVGVPAEN